MGIFLFPNNFWDLLEFVLVIASSIFQTVCMDSTTNDSFEKLLNQFVPMNQRWFSSDRARPRFRVGAVRPKCQTSVRRAEARRANTPGFWQTFARGGCGSLVQ